MPVPAARLRLSPSFSSPLLRDVALQPHLRQSLITSAHRGTGQTAVFVSCTGSTLRPVRSLRSPLQWSHIVHRFRLPAKMATDPQTTLGQVRTHMGHSHSHDHNHDNTYLTSTNKSDPGVRITRIGLYVNLGMAIAKGFGGYVFNSQASVTHSEPQQSSNFDTDGLG